MSVENLTTVDISDGVPDWVHSAYDLVNEDTIEDELGISQNNIPRHRATVLHDSYSTSKVTVPSKVVRIEARVGNNYNIDNNYDMTELTDHPNFITYSFGDDPTYVSFFFELTEDLEHVVNLVE